MYSFVLATIFFTVFYSFEKFFKYMAEEIEVYLCTFGKNSKSGFPKGGQF